MFTIGRVFVLLVILLIGYLACLIYFEIYCPQVYSESSLDPMDLQKRNELFRKIDLRASFYPLPKNVIDLYMGISSGFFSDSIYISFRLDDETECKELLKSVFHVNYEDLSKTSGDKLPKELLERK